MEAMGIPRPGWVLLRGIAITAGLTAICFYARVPAAAMACLYMMATVLQSLDSGFLEATVLAVLTTACLDYFFMDPLFSMRLSDPADVTSVACLLAASLLTIRLQTRHRELSRVAAAAHASAEAEMLRSVVLDGLAHELKTPLAAIVTAAGGLRETVPGEDQRQLAEMIETEALRLGELTTRLLRLAQLDQKEVKPRMELADPVELVSRIASEHRAFWPDREIVVKHSESVSDVEMDPELIELAVTQLVENACKYSSSGSRVLMEVSGEDHALSVAVWNKGAPIAAIDRPRIFERYQRGTGEFRNTSGTGLGLYVARKIVLAHGGDAMLMEERPGLVGFRLTIPAPRRLN